MVHDHAKFIDRFERVAVPGPGVGHWTIDDRISRRVIDGVFAHGVTADRARPQIGRTPLFRTAWGLPILNHAITIRPIGQKGTQLVSKSTRGELVLAESGFQQGRECADRGPGR